MRQRSSRPLLLLAAVAGGIALIAAASGHGTRPSFARATQAETWRGLLGGARPQVAQGQRVIVVLNAPSLADRVARAGGPVSDSTERRWTAAAHAAQQQLLFELASRGVVARPQYRFTRVLNGFSAALDARAMGVLLRAPQVRAVYAVRPAYPASFSRGALSRAVVRLGLDPSSAVSLGGYDGRGVTVALLDTGVDRWIPYLHGHVLPGIDVAGRSSDARPRRRPDAGHELERHGTEMAGLLVGAGGPGGLAGVAPQATVLPIRVAGWQPDAAGSFAVYARTDQIIEGLEKAVDPNGDGDAHDAANVALLPLVEPFAAFSDSPLAQAARGALKLDTLVVAAAGNDGPAGPSFGSVGGPGGAPDALTVGAADARSTLVQVPLAARIGLHVLLRRRVPLANALDFRGRLELDVAQVGWSHGALTRLFDAHGLSLVAGRAVLVPTGADPRAAARQAVDAGAAAVLLAGDTLPAGSLGLDPTLTAPVVGVPGALADLVREALARGRRATVAVGDARVSPTRGSTVAEFSSQGLAFDARPKPDLVAPGVGLATADPGLGPNRTSRFLTVSGTSVAAATAAGAAALLLQARPGLGALGVRGALVGSARRLSDEPLTAQGAGLLDVGAAAASELSFDPASVSFGRGSGDGWQASRTVLVRDVSSRSLDVYAAVPRSDQARVAVEVTPHRFRVAPGRAVRLRLTARLVSGLPVGAAVAGVLSLAPVDAPPARIPWALVLDQAAPPLLGAPQLSAESFRPSDVSPAVLSLQAGEVEQLASGGTAVVPVARLDVELRDASGRLLGLLARERDLLPGRYTFGLTGRGPLGHVLPRGRYGLRLVAWPTDGGPPGVRAVAFRIE